MNGRIAALTRPFTVRGKQGFSAVVSEAVFHEGFNRIALFAVDSARPMLRAGERLSSPTPADRLLTLDELALKHGFADS